MGSEIRNSWFNPQETHKRSRSRNFCAAGTIYFVRSKKSAGEEWTRKFFFTSHNERSMYSVWQQRLEVLGTIEFLPTPLAPVETLLTVLDLNT